MLQNFQRGKGRFSCSIAGALALATSIAGGLLAQTHLKERERRARVRASWPVLFILLALLVTPFLQASQPLTVVAWGDNAYSECDVPADLTNAVALTAASGYSIALLTNGALRDWGGNGYSPPEGLSNVRAVSERTLVGMALLTGGTVSVWGNGTAGSTNLPAGLSNIVAVAAGENFGLGLKGDGTLAGWGGQNGEGVPPAVNDGLAIAAGLNYGLVLRSNGTVIAWGWNLYGITNVPASLSNVVAISAGGYHGVALKSDGTVVVWGGQNASVQPPPGLSNVVAISAGLWHTLALKQDGTVVTWGDDSLIPPAGLTNVVAVSAGYSHSLALTASQIPILGVQPNNMTLNAGGSGSFTVRAFGPSLTYQWQLNGANLPGATGKTLSLTNVQSADAGSYRAVITNSFGTVTSAGASLSVNPFLAITQQPQNQTGYVGNTATLSVTAAGSTPLSYQWTKGNGPLVLVRASAHVGNPKGNAPAVSHGFD